MSGMWLTTRAFTAVGLDVGVDAVRGVVLRHSRRQVSLVSAAEAPLPDRSGFGEGHDPTIASAVAAELLSRLRIRRAAVATAISAADAVVRRLVLPRQPRTALAACVESSVRQDLPFAIDDVGVVWEAKRSRAGEQANLDVLAVAARRSAIDDQAAIVAQAGHVPVVIDVEPLALANAHELNYPEHAAEDTMLVNVSRGRATICLLQRGAVAAVADAAVPQSNLSDAPFIIKRLVQRDPATRSMFAGTSRMLLSGEACQAHGLAERLSHDFGVPVEFFEPFRRVATTAAAIGPNLVGSSFAIAVGLASRRKGDS